MSSMQCRAVAEVKLKDVGNIQSDLNKNAYCRKYPGIVSAEIDPKSTADINPIH